METIEELNSNGEFKKLCDLCHVNCKDNSKLCLAKKLAYNLAKREYKKRVKKGLIKEC